MTVERKGRFEVFAGKSKRSKRWGQTELIGFFEINVVGAPQVHTTFPTQVVAAMAEC